MANKQERLNVEKMFGGFRRYEIDELEEGAPVILETAFDDSMEVDERLANLETYLAMMFFLYQKRLMLATDFKEMDLLSEMTLWFSKRFVPTDMERSMYEYCIEQADESKKRGWVDKEARWAILARDIVNAYLG